MGRHSRSLKSKHKQKKSDPTWGKSNKGLGVNNRWKKKKPFSHR